MPGTPHPGEKIENNSCPCNIGSALTLGLPEAALPQPQPDPAVVSHKNLWAVPAQGTFCCSFRGFLPFSGVTLTLFQMFCFQLAAISFKREISLACEEVLPHNNQLHLKLALPLSIAYGEEPDGSAAAEAKAPGSLLEK